MSKMSIIEQFIFMYNDLKSMLSNKKTSLLRKLRKHSYLFGQIFDL